MKIGEIVEILNDMRREQKPCTDEEEALIEACNILEKLPRLAEATEYNP